MGADYIWSWRLEPLARLSYRADDGRRHEASLDRDGRGYWVLRTIPTPEEWIGKPIHTEAEASGMARWLNDREAEPLW